MQKIRRNYLEEFRKCAGLSLDDVAAQLGHSSPRAYIYFESGHRDLSMVRTIQLFVKLANAYHVPLMTLMQGEVDYVCSILAAMPELDDETGNAIDENSSEVL